MAKRLHDKFSVFFSSYKALVCGWIFSVMRHPDVVEEGSVPLETRSHPTMMVFHWCLILFQ